MEKKCKIIYLNNFIYILSDDEIKEGDLHITSDHSGFGFRKYKIIATTDTSLKTDNPNYDIGKLAYITLPQPSQQFIEKYIESYNKGEVITDILVEYEIDKLKQLHTDSNSLSLAESLGSFIHWKLKVNTKDNSITIKKLKDNWNREEVKQFAIKAFQAGFDYCGASHLGCPDESNWIEENL